MKKSKSPLSTEELEYLSTLRKPKFDADTEVVSVLDIPMSGVTDNVEYNKEMYDVLTNRTDNNISFTVPDGISEEELLLLMKEKRKTILRSHEFKKSLQESSDLLADELKKNK